MNWGHKITLVIIAFILCILAMVIVAIRQTNEMIDQNYYEKEMKYQSIIDASQNLFKQYQGDLVTQNKEELLLIIPMSLMENFKNGTLEFLKIDDQSKDFHLTFIPNSRGQFSIDKASLSLGLYKVRTKWTSNQKVYYQEQSIQIKK